MRGTARLWGAWWVLLAALYLLLADNTALPELVTGAVAAAVGATGAVLCQGERMRPHARWLRTAWRPLTGVFADLVPLARTLVTRGILRRGGTGTLVRVPAKLDGDAAEQAAFAALTEALGSLAPNTIVVDVDRDGGAVLVHQLVATAEPAAPLAP